MVTGIFFVSFFTLVTGPSRSLSLTLSDTGVYEPHMRARLGTAGIEAMQADVVSELLSSSLLLSSLDLSDTQVYEP